MAASRDAHAKSNKQREADGGSAKPIDRRLTVAPIGTSTIEAGDPSLGALPKQLPTLDRDERYPNVPIIT